MIFSCGNKFRLLNNNEFVGIVKICSGITYFKLRRVNRYEKKRKKGKLIVKNNKDFILKPRMSNLN